MLLNSTGVYTQKLSLKLRSRNSSTTIGNVVVVGSAGKKQQIGVVNKQHFIYLKEEFGKRKFRG